MLAKGCNTGGALRMLALATSNTSLDPFGMTGCNLLVANGGPAYIGLATTSTDASGSAFLQFSLPEFLSRGLVYFQWFHGAPRANALNLQSTKRLRIEIIK